MTRIPIRTTYELPKATATIAQDVEAHYRFNKAFNSVISSLREGMCNDVSTEEMLNRLSRNIALYSSPNFSFTAGDAKNGGRVRFDDRDDTYKIHFRLKSDHPRKAAQELRSLFQGLNFNIKCDFGFDSVVVIIPAKNAKDFRKKFDLPTGEELTQAVKEFVEERLTDNTKKWTEILEEYPRTLNSIVKRATQSQEPTLEEEGRNR